MHSTALSFPPMRPARLLRSGVPALTALVLLVFSSGCGLLFEVVTPPQTARRQALFTRYGQRHAGLSPEGGKRIATHCPFGMPQVDTSVPLGPTHYVQRDGYVLQHSSVLKIPLWVCEGVTREQLQGSIPRSDPFRPDPLLPKGQRAELADYRRSGFDRGHQAPAGDQSVDARLKAETFFLSNMAPQVPQLNQKIWAALEEQVRQWVRARGFAFVVTGPLFYDPAEEDESTADGLVEYKTIGPGAVAVPTHFYKLVVARNSPGEWEAIAFVLGNQRYPRADDFTPFIKSIDWIEERTGLNFMPDLAPLEERRLEAQPSPLWK